MAATLSFDFSSFHTFQRTYLDAQVLYYSGRTEELPEWLVFFFKSKTTNFLVQNTFRLEHVKTAKAPEHHIAYTILKRVDEISQQIFEQVQEGQPVKLEFENRLTSRDPYLFKYHNLLLKLVCPRVWAQHPDLVFRVSRSAKLGVNITVLEEERLNLLSR